MTAVKIEIDFRTPDVIRQDEASALWESAQHFTKTPGRRNTYSIRLFPNGEHRIEDLVGDAMGYIRSKLPTFDPYQVVAIAVHVTEVGPVPL